MNLKSSLYAALLMLPMSALAFGQQSPVPSRTLTLLDAEKIAMEKNPALAQAEAEIQAARGRAHQAGLYPNPMIGMTGDENSPGPVIRGGEFGFFIQQEIVLGGKLDKSRRIASQEVAQATVLAEARKLRVLTGVRRLFYGAIAAQRTVEIRERLVVLTRDAVATSKQLLNVGQADQPDVLQIEIDLDRSELALTDAERAREQAWRQLAVAVGDTSLEKFQLAGDLEQIPELAKDSALTVLLRDSPEMRVAELEASRGKAVVDRARAEKVPNLDVRGGIRNNRELLEAGGVPVGAEGFFDVGVRIPIFNRNQGAVAAAEADLTSAHKGVERVRLSLESRFAATYREYADARAAVERYRSSLLPRAQRAYDLYLAGFRQMSAAYPQALIAQRTLLQVQEEYTAALGQAWIKAAEIQGFLLAEEFEPGLAGTSFRGGAK